MVTSHIAFLFSVQRAIVFFNSCLPSFFPFCLLYPVNIKKALRSKEVVKIEKTLEKQISKQKHCALSGTIIAEVVQAAVVLEVVAVRLGDLTVVPPVVELPLEGLLGSWEQ